MTCSEHVKDVKTWHKTPVETTSSQKQVDVVLELGTAPPDREWMPCPQFVDALARACNPWCCLGQTPVLEPCCQATWNIKQTEKGSPFSPPPAFQFSFGAVALTPVGMLEWPVGDVKCWYLGSPRPLENKTLGMGPGIYCFQKVLRVFLCRVMVAIYCLVLP